MRASYKTNACYVLHTGHFWRVNIFIYLAAMSTMISYNNVEERKWWHLAAKSVPALLPTYWVGLLLALPVTFLACASQSGNELGMFLSTTMTFGFFPFAKGTSLVMAHCWFLSCLAGFYLIFPLLKLMVRSPRAFVVYRGWRPTNMEDVCWLAFVSLPGLVFTKIPALGHFWFPLRIPNCTCVTFLLAETCFLAAVFANTLSFGPSLLRYGFGHCCGQCAIVTLHDQVPRFGDRYHGRSHADGYLLGRRRYSDVFCGACVPPLFCFFLIFGVSYAWD